MSTKKGKDPSNVVDYPLTANSVTTGTPEDPSRQLLNSFWDAEWIERGRIGIDLSFLASKSTQITWFPTGFPIHSSLHLPFSSGGSKRDRRGVHRSLLPTAGPAVCRWLFVARWWPK